MSDLEEERERLRADRAEAARLLAEARAAYRSADRKRSRARKLGGRIASKLHYALATASAQLEADREALDARTARFDAAQTAFHLNATSARDRLRDAWADLTAQQKRLAEDWEEANRFQALQAAALDAHAAELAAREQSEAEAKASLHHIVGALREEAAALDVRVRNTRQVVEELERQREKLRSQALAPAKTNSEPQRSWQIALDRAGDRNLQEWADELVRQEDRLKLERTAVAAVLENTSRDKAEIADQRRVLAEHFTELAAARAGWQEAERTTVLEMEQLARTLRLREGELDARERHLSRADARRREDNYNLWQRRLRLETWQSKLVAFEMRWHTEREQLDSEFTRREESLIARELRVVRGTNMDEDEIPLAAFVPEFAPAAIPAELIALREEVERMAATMLETELPEPPEPPDRELPWGTELDSSHREPDEADVLVFETTQRAA